MTNTPPVSNQTRNNWLVVFLLSLSGLLTIFSSVYFLFLPNGGYQGGRNPYYGIAILFTRTTWDLIHTWAGVMMIAIASHPYSPALVVDREYDKTNLSNYARSM